MTNYSHFKEGQELEKEGSFGYLIQKYLFISAVDHHIMQLTIGLELCI